MTYRELLEAWAGECDVTYKALVGPGRSKEIVRARHVAAHILHVHVGLSLVETGSELGGRDHSTVINGLRRARELLEDDELRRRVHRFVEEALRIELVSKKPLPPGGTPLERAEGLGHVPLMDGFETTREALDRLWRNGSSPD